ncbi:MAG: LamG domain-containing protein [Lentisphaeria bacterium]|nr:LamG domain-containing protein [Lentisphaeria bacterium]
MISLKKMLWLAVLGTISLAAQENAAKNLLMNPDFQIATEPGYPDFWDGASGWLPGTHTLVDSGFIKGTKSMCLTMMGKSEVKYFTGNFGWSPGKPGTPYTFSVYLKSEPAGAKVKIGSFRFKSEIITVSGEWKRYVVSGPLTKLGGFSGRFIKPEIILQPCAKGTKLYINAPMLSRTANAVDFVNSNKQKTVTKPAVDLQKSLVAFWRLDKLVNNQIADLSGKGMNGTVVGTFKQGDTTLGKGMLFDGKTYVNIPYNPALDIQNNEVTVELVLKPEPAKVMQILNHRMHWGGYALMITYNKYAPHFGGWKSFHTVPPLPETAHVVMTYKKPYGYFYYNGALEGSKLLNTDLKKNGGKKAFTIGGFDIYKPKIGYRTYPTFKGVINYVKVYNRAVTADEVKQLYKNRQENMK